MRLIKMIGGLGNQMFIYAFYLQMKKRFPNTKIDLSDMMDYHVHNGYEINRIFKLPVPVDEFCISSKWKKVIEFFFCKTVLERKQNLETMEAFTRSYVWPLVYFKGFYQSERFFADVRDEVRQAFTFNVDMISRLTKASLRWIDREKAACSIHVRRGDYLQPKYWENAGSVCTLDYYRNAIARVRELYPDVYFFIFSDDLEWVRENLPFTDEEGLYMDGNERPEDSWQDMMMMSHCRIHIICNSTFSWWGAYLSDKPGKLVLAPERWFRHTETPYIYPEGWVKIPVE